MQGFFQLLLSRYVVIVKKDLWVELWLSTFVMKLSKKKNYQNKQKSFSSTCSLLPLFLNKKIKLKHEIPWLFHIIQKSPLLKTRKFHFFLIWLMECSIYLHVWLAKKFSDTLTLYNLIKLHTYYNFEKVKVQQNKY